MARQLRLSLAQAPTATFDDYVQGPSNAEALAALKTWPAWPGGCLALVGPPGSGKSHLAAAWAREAGAAVYAASDPLPAAGPVLVEDAERGIAAEHLFHLINAAPLPGRGLLLTGRTRPAAWAAALPDLRSRLNAMPVAEIEAPDDAVLEGVLRRFFRNRNIRPPEAVFPYLLTRMNRSIPDAAEIVRRLDEAGDEGFRPVTRALARHVLGDQPQLDL